MDTADVQATLRVAEQAIKDAQKAIVRLSQAIYLAGVEGDGVDTFQVSEALEEAEGELEVLEANIGDVIANEEEEGEEDE